MQTDFKFILKVFLIWRVFLFIPLLFLGLISAKETIYLNNIWGNFDGIHYLDIAQKGYINEVRFFPLFPELIGLLGRVVGNYFIAGLILSNTLLILGLIFLYKLLKIDHPDSVCRQSLIFLLAFPTAFFFGSIYSESLFLFLLTASFYYARKNNFIVSSILGGLLSATRLPGVFILPALLTEIWLGKRLKRNLLNILFVLGSSMGLILYSFYNFSKWGNPFQFILAQGDLSNSRSVTSLVFPLQTLYRYIKIFISVPINQFEWWIALLEAGLFIFGVVILLLGIRYKIRLSYLLFSFLAFLLPSFSGTFSGLPRYMLILFPIFLVLALIKNRFIKISYVLASVLLQLVLLAYFARGYYIA